jgi:hypothetical protein
MKKRTACLILTSASLLIGCTSLTPKDYGFQRVAIRGADCYCAPREWVVPPVVPQEAAGDPQYPLYREFLALPDRYVDSDLHAPTREVCITQSQWPRWLTMRTQWNADWAITPQKAEERAAERAAGL